MSRAAWAALGAGPVTGMDRPPSSKGSQTRRCCSLGLFFLEPSEFQATFRNTSLLEGKGLEGRVRVEASFSMRFA